MSAAPAAAAAALGRMLAPRSVAVVGASPRPEALSGRFVTGLLRHGFPGPVIPVNPHYDEVAGLACVGHVADAGPVDLAILAVPRRLVLETLEACAAAGVAGAVVFASGYAETGEDGRAAEARIAALAGRTGMRVLGPNSPGFVNASEGCCAIASGVAFRESIPAGGVAVVAQSGGVAGLLAERAMDRRVGLSRVVCTGNEADVGAGEVLAHLAADPSTRAVALFLEGIRDAAGLRAGLEALREAGTPAVVLKVGATAVGARASAAHTGALATADDVVDAVLARAGAVRMGALDDLVDAATLLAAHGPARSPAVGIVSTSGGAGIVAAEAAERAGLALPPLAEATAARISAGAPRFASTANPTDMSGMFVEDPEVFRASLAAMLDDPGLDAVVLVLTVQPPALAERLAQDAIAAARAADTPLVVLWVAGAMSEPARDALRSAGVAVVEDPERCMRALAARAVVGRPTAPILPAPRLALPEMPDAPLESEVLAALGRAGVATVPGRLCADAEEARSAAGALGGPLAVKAAARDLAHKSDAGAVALGVEGPEAAAEAFARVTGAARAAGARVEGALVQAMALPGVELIVGVYRDPRFGPLVVVGLGGLGAEVHADVSRRLLPLRRGEARIMLGELRGAALLGPHRGRPAVHLDAVAAAIEGVAALALALGERLEALEVNPLVAGPDGAMAVDALLITAGT